MAVKRIFIGPSKTKVGENVIAVNPDLLYFDTSVWIELFKSYLTEKKRIIDEIAKAIGNDEFRLMVSTVNFFELIGPHGDISKNFSSDHFSALDYVRQTSVHQPTIITEQEVDRFVNKTKNYIRILDNEGVAINSIIEAFKQRENGNIKWFQDIRGWWDEVNERDRAMNLDADLYELSGIITYDSFLEMSKSRKSMLNGPFEKVKTNRLELIQKKKAYKGKKIIPSKEEEILKWIKHRIEMNLIGKYGVEKMSMVISNLGIVFPGWTDVAKDINRSAQLTLSKAKKEFPGLYWQAKIGYYNYYHGPQRRSGQLGDRNHAVYIPYCNYFATSDEILIKALMSEFSAIFVKNNIHLFKVTQE